MHKKRIDSLSSLRFFAIALVAVHHLGELIGWAPRSGWGNVGVTFFFVLSGFLLTVNYQGAGRAFRPAEFLWRRFSRIYPLHLLTFLMSIAVLQLNGLHFDIFSAVINVLLLQSWFSLSNIFFAFNSVSWALSALAFFYAAFVFIQARFVRHILMVGFISIASIIISVAYLASRPDEPLLNQWLLQMLPCNRVFVFLMGVAAAKLFSGLRDRFFFKKMWVMSIAEGGMAILLIDRLASCHVFNFLLGLIYQYWGISGLLVCQVVDTYIFSPILFCCMFLIFGVQRGLLSRLLMWKPFVFLGEMSFAVYLSHQLIYRAVAVLFRGYSHAILIGVAFSAIMVLAYGLYRWVEIPCKQWLTLIFKKMTEWKQA